MEEDLRKLSFFETLERIWTDDRKIAEQERTIESLRSELRAAQDSLAKLEAKKESEPIPTFEVGKCYRNRNGETRGPLERIEPSGGLFVWRARNQLNGRNETYRVGGNWAASGDSDEDLLPCAVDPPPTWTPPASFPDGEYWFFDTGFGIGRKVEDWRYDMSIPKLFKDFVRPPCNGLWQVKDGKATYLGES